MVKTTGPMFSLDARGTLGDSVIFSKGKKSTFAKKFHKPTNPRSDKQIARRAMIKFLTQTWTGLHNSYKNSFNVMAAKWNISPYHAFLKFNSQRWTAEQPPAVLFPTQLIQFPSIVAAEVSRSGSSWAFRVLHLSGLEAGLTLLVKARSPTVTDWDSMNYIGFYGPNVPVGGPQFETTGVWTAPDDAQYGFLVKLASFRGALSGDGLLFEV